MKQDNRPPFSEELKSLILALLEEDPIKRPTVDQILDFPWMKEEIYSQEELKAEMVKYINGTSE